LFPFALNKLTTGAFVTLYQHTTVWIVWLLRVIAVLLAGWAAYWTYFAIWFRLEGSDEFEWVKKVDFEHGGCFALALEQAYPLGF
jgi:hypothetical protein